MRIKDVIKLYDFYRPLCVEVFGGSPFRCQYSGYVVDGKLIDYNDNIIVMIFLCLTIIMYSISLSIIGGFVFSFGGITDNL